MDNTANKGESRGTGGQSVESDNPDYQRSKIMIGEYKKKYHVA
jgi:hypothetical protein